MSQKDCFLNADIIGKRKIIIWGAGVRGNEMAGLLGGYGYEIEGFIDAYLGGKGETVRGLPVYGEGYLKGKQDSLFVLVSMDRYYEEVKKFLYDQDYAEITDFFWLNRTPIELQAKSGVYQDDLGNVLKIRCDASNLRVVFMGKNNHLDIDGSVSIKKNMSIYLAGGGSVSIKNSFVYGLCNINVVNGGCLTIQGKSIVKAYTVDIRQKSSAVMTNLLLEGGGNLEVSGHSVCKISDGVMDGICKVSNYSDLSMEQIYSKAKKIIVYRKGSLQIRKTGLDRKAEISVGDAAKARIFNSEIGKKARLSVRRHSDLSMEETLFEKGVLSISEASKAAFLDCRIRRKSDMIVWNHSVLSLKQTKFQEAEMKCTNDAEIAVEESTFGSQSRISANQDTKINICSMETREGASLIGYFHSQIHIGRNCKATKNLYLLADHGSSLSVGEDCILAQDVTILSGDSHPVFQVDRPQTYEACSRIRISDHVWLGKGSVVLSDASIGESSIVAPHSVVGKNYPNNCLLMGYPAKILRQNITYDLKQCNPEEITDKHYWNLTNLKRES